MERVKGWTAAVTAAAAKKKVKCDMTSVSLAVNACHLDEQEENDDDLLLAVFEGKCGKEGVTQCSQANRCAPVSC